MKREYIRLWSFIIAATLILTAVLILISHSFKSSRQDEIDKEYEIISEIDKANDKFLEKVEEYTTKKQKFDEDLKEYTSYFSGMYDRYDKITTDFRNLENYVIDVENESIYLNQNCINKMYSNRDTNAKCMAYISNFEKTVNMFVSDVEYLNKKIDEYNEWYQTNKEENDKNKSLEHLTVSRYSEYIDINGDGTYLGKSE